MMYRGLLVWVAVMMWGCLAACAGGQRPLPIPSQPLATEVLPSVITSTPVAQATATTVPTARFTYQGVTFSYANGLVRRLTTERLAAAQGITGIALDTPPVYHFGVPDFLVFDFVADREGLAPSRLVVQRLRADEGQFYEGYDAEEIGRFETLAARLEAQTAVDPLTRYLDFDNGLGIRTVSYLPVFSGAVPLSDAQLFYLFEGLTRDGRYYIWLQFNLQTPILPDEPGQFTGAEKVAMAETAVYQAYLRDQLALVTTLPTTAFTPDLALLDNLIQSLSVPADASTASSLPLNEPDCSNTAAYISDVTIPNGTRVAAGQSFLKTWRIQNSGSCTWSAAYQLVNENNALPRAEEPTLPIVLPGETVDISIAYRAPTEPGIYQETWQLQTPSMLDQEPANELFGPTLTVSVQVVENGP